MPIPDDERWYTWEWSDTGEDTGTTYRISGEFRTRSSNSILRKGDIYYHQYTLQAGNNKSYLVDTVDRKVTLSDGTELTEQGSSPPHEIKFNTTTNVFEEADDTGALEFLDLRVRIAVSVTRHIGFLVSDSSPMLWRVYTDSVDTNSSSSDSNAYSGNAVITVSRKTSQ